MRSASSSSVQSTPTSTSKCARSSATPESPIFSFTRTFRRSPAVVSGVASLTGELVDHQINTGGEGLHVVRVDGREHPDAQALTACIDWVVERLPGE